MGSRRVLLKRQKKPNKQLPIGGVVRLALP